MPRITAEEKRAQNLARKAAEDEMARLTKRKGAKKLVPTQISGGDRMLKLEAHHRFVFIFRDTKLLSFGDEEDQDSGVIAGGKKKNMARPDCEEDVFFPCSSLLIES